MKFNYTEVDIESLYDHLLILSPLYQRMPKLGRAHLERLSAMEENSILLTYLSPDRTTVIHNETTSEEMKAQGVTPLQALQNSLKIMDLLHGGKCPGAFLQSTFDTGTPDDGAINAEWRKRHS